MRSKACLQRNVVRCVQAVHELGQKVPGPGFSDILAPSASLHRLFGSDSMNQYEILVAIGSLRRESINRKLANAVMKLAPPEFTFREATIGDLPPYNQDDDANQAGPVKRLKGEI